MRISIIMTHYNVVFGYKLSVETFSFCVRNKNCSTKREYIINQSKYGNLVRSQKRSVTKSIQKPQEVFAHFIVGYVVENKVVHHMWKFEFCKQEIILQQTSEVIVTMTQKQRRLQQRARRFTFITLAFLTITYQTKK